MLPCCKWSSYTAFLIICLAAIPVYGRNQEQKLEQKAMELFVQSALEARPYFQKLYERQPYNDRVRYRLALCYLYPGQDLSPEVYRQDLAEAVTLLKESIGIHSGIQEKSRPVADRYFHLGVAYWYSGNRVAALDAFRKSEETGFALPLTGYYRFILLEELGRIAEADALRHNLTK